MDKQDVKTIVSIAIERVLADNNLNITKLAKNLNTSRTSVSNYYNKKCLMPLHKFLNMCRIYNVRIDLYLGLYKLATGLTGLKLVDEALNEIKNSGEEK